MHRALPAFAATAALALAGAAVAAPVTIYPQPGFGGEALAVEGPVRDLRAADFKDRAASIVVDDGAWEFCSEPNFNGSCSVLMPGRYAKLDPDLDRRIESIREMEKVGPGKWLPRETRSEIRRGGG